MKEKPILFSTDMVRAILDGRKTQTRRVVKNVKIEQNRHNPDAVNFSYKNTFGNHVPKETLNDNFLGILSQCPYGKPGDVLWVRERFCKDFYSRYWYYQQFDFSKKYHYVHDSTRNEEIQFKANDFKPSIHMPKAAAGYY